jgi:hypothetical protein
MLTRICLVVCTLVAIVAAQGNNPIEIGSRRELFVDDLLVDRMAGAVHLYLHKPVPREVAIVHNEPWEGDSSQCHTVFLDGNTYRMYYRASGGKNDAANPRIGYAESADGIHWLKPKLGLVEFDGSKANNLILDSNPKLGTGAFTPFRDTNPKASEDARYKAIAEKGAAALYGYKSHDAIHWQVMNNGKPILTPHGNIELSSGKPHFFDSQNLVFWDNLRKKYVMYFREWDGRLRMIRTITSEDFEKWEIDNSERLSYSNADIYGGGIQLYTNSIQPYERAPHIYIGFPTRLGADESTEPYFMASRDGQLFRYWGEYPVIPKDAPKDRQGNRANYLLWGLVPTGGKEYSVYASEGYEDVGESRLRRFTYRIDGFASVRGMDNGGELLTKPLTFSGEKMQINFSTLSGRGRVRVELQDEHGTPIPGFTLEHCDPLTGDEIDRMVTWGGKSDVSEFSGQTVRLRFVICDADVYSFKFERATTVTP